MSWLHLMQNPKYVFCKYKEFGYKQLTLFINTVLYDAIRRGKLEVNISNIIYSYRLLPVIWYQVDSFISLSSPRDFPLDLLLTITFEKVSQAVSPEMHLRTKCEK